MQQENEIPKCHEQSETADTARQNLPVRHQNKSLISFQKTFHQS